MADETKATQDGTKAAQDGTDDKPRDLDTLLRMTTYQGMSDVEIQSLIEYHRRNAYSQGQTDAQNSASATQAARAQEDAKRAWQDAQAALTNACAISPNFRQIGLTNA